MATASPQQLGLFRRRRRAALLVEIAALIAAPVAAVAVLVVLGEQRASARVAAAAVFVLVFVAGQLARRAWFRCPVCAGPLPRGARHVKPADLFKGYCGRCGTEFPG